MASPLRLTLADLDGRSDQRRADAAWFSVRAEFEAAEQAMSRFRATSEITALNRAAGSGIAVRVSRRLELALVAADRAHRLTSGRFDPRVVDVLEGLGDRGAALPAAALRSPASRRIVRRTCLGTLIADAPIDLGGIGKGLALRWAAARLARELDGVAFLLDAGGDLVASGGGPADGPWRIGIEDPAGGAPLAVVAIPEGAIATSSTRLRRWEVGGRVAHHLIDPATREPGGDGLASVTVAAPDPAWAEVRSKALFLEGAAGIAGAARRLGIAAWWVTADGALEMTPAARVLTVWASGDRNDEAEQADPR